MSIFAANRKWLDIMAKRKGKAKPRNRKKQTVPFLSTLKRMFVWACFVVACFIGLLFLYNYFYPTLETKSVEVKQEKRAVASKPVSRKQEPSRSDTKTFKVPAHAEIPRLTVKRSEQIIKHEGYTVSYNSNYKIANWVAYELTSKEAKSKKNERSNKFVMDPAVKGASAMNEDYTRSGYDRGHLAPAGDMKWSAKAMRESFYLSNICPQKPGLNRGIWKELEEQARLWAMDNGSLLVVTGPVITDNMKRLGKNRVGIPGSFYKVFGMLTENGYKGIAFIFENRDYKNTSLKSMAISVDSAEKVTGIDFFPSLPGDQQKKMEATVDWHSWSF